MGEARPTVIAILGTGTSPNSVKTQIRTALIAILLLRYLQRVSTFGWSLANLVALLR